MSRPPNYYRVTGKKLEKFLVDFYKEYDKALNTGRRFSRRQGGHRDRIGTIQVWGTTNLAIVFKNEPDKSLWKISHKDSSEFWVPKRNQAAKKLREEFETLERAVPDKCDISEAIGFNGFFGDSDFAYYDVGVGCYDSTWVLALPDYYKPKKGIGLKRISDIVFEKLAA